jgi:hypothetical protein
LPNFNYDEVFGTVLNQITETFSVNELADRVQKVGQKLGYSVEKKNYEVFAFF